VGAVHVWLVAGLLDAPHTESACVFPFESLQTTVRVCVLLLHEHVLHALMLHAYVTGAWA